MKNKFNVGHFPIGTVAEFHVTGIFNSVPFIGTVGEVAANGPDSWVIRFSDRTDNLFPNNKGSINLHWCTKIIKRGNGGNPVNFKTNSNYGMYTHELKHHSQYFSIGYRELVRSVAERYLNYTMLLDIDKLCRMLVEQGAISIKYIDRMPCVKVNKKRLNTSIKRLINKCLLKRAMEQIRRDRECADDYYKECCNGLWD